MMRNEVMIAAKLMAKPLSVGPPGSFGAAAHFLTAAEGLTQASSPPGTGSPLLPAQQGPRLSASRRWSYSPSQFPFYPASAGTNYASWPGSAGLLECSRSQP